MRSAPLTARQTLMWLDHQLYPSAPYHNLVLTIELAGELDVERLRRAFDDLVRANDSLRAAVLDEGGQMRMVIADEHALALEHADLSSAPESFTDWLRDRCTQRRDLARCVGDAVLVRLAPARHVLYFSQHHIASDGSSLVEVCDQLAARYSGRAVEVGPSILEYAEHERGYRASDRAAKSAAFWAKSVGSGVPPLALYGMHRASTSVGTRRTEIALDAATIRAFVDRAAHAPFQLATPELSRLTVLMTALFAYLHRVSGNPLLAIGVPVRNRPARFRRTLGLLMEQPFVIVEIGEGETIQSLAEKTRKALFDALRNAQHTLSDRGVFYATLNLHPWVQAQFDGLQAEVAISPAPVRAQHVPGASGDLRDTVSLLVFDRLAAGELELALELHTDTFPEELQRRAQFHLREIVRAIAAGSDVRLDAIGLLADSERADLIAAGRGPDAPIAPDIVAAIRARALARPTATALISDEVSLTYAELERRTDQLAHHLRSLGVGPEVRVGVYVARGPDEPLSMLAVLKAGGAYVPLDPSHPAERVEMILHDAAPSVLLTHRHFVRRFERNPDMRIVALDEGWPRLRALPPTSSETEVCPDQLAYVLFTSGSTGRPKGVEITRHALSNLLQSMAKQPGMSAADRLLAITTITFDIAGLEMFLPLWTGGTLQIASRETALDPLVLRATLDRDPVTVLQATPTTWRLLVESGWKGKPGLRMLCGGEALSLELARALLSRGGELWNMYGPTETTIWSTVQRIVPDLERVTIGRSIDRTQTYVLDAAHSLVPQGVVGELCIGGDGVARGLLANPEREAERFVPDSHGAQGKRLYRTGDLARLLANGELECLGRADHQVKVRGFRIELGEIESVLRAVAGVKDVVVVARREGASEAQLVAYWIGDANANALMERARQRLPDYMQPSAYVRLDAFPLNTNGKIDRKALPAPAESTLADARPRARGLHALTNPEARVASIWRELLGRRDVGPDDEFFENGGDSLLAVRLRERLRQELGVELPLTALFQQPTIAGMTAALESQAGLNDSPVAIALRRASDERPALFCLFGLALYQPLANAIRSDCSVYGVHVPFAVAPNAVSPSLVPELAALYVDTIRRTRPKGPYHIGGLCFGGVIAYEVTRQLLEAGERVESLSLFDAMMPRAQTRRRGKQLMYLCRRVVEEPRRLGTWLDGSRARLVMRARLRAGRLGLWNDWASGASEVARSELRVLSTEAEMAAIAYDRYAEAVTTPTMLFRAQDSDFPAWLDIAPDYGWGELARGFVIHEVTGHHVEIMQEPHVQAIARVLDGVLS